MAITCELCKKRAQIFTVDGSFSPTKASVYLRTSLYDNSSYWDLDITQVISVANFSEKTTDTTSQVYATDVLSGFDSKAYMQTDANGGSDWPVLYYPIKAGMVGDFDVYVYQRNSSGFTANLLVDNQVEDSISDGTSGSFTWSSSGTITISDTSKHTLGLQFTTNGISADKIIVQKAGDPAPGSEVLTESPYNTIHAQIYTVSLDKPSSPLIINDYKNTINDVTQDGWYNFDLNFLTTSGIVSFNDENYALVLFAAGAREKNFVSWEILDSNEYLSLPVAAES